MNSEKIKELKHIMENPKDEEELCAILSEICEKLNKDEMTDEEICEIVNSMHFPDEIEKMEEEPKIVTR